MSNTQTALEEILGARDYSLDRVIPQPGTTAASILPYRGRILALREQVDILADYYEWGRADHRAAWCIATKLLRQGATIGRIIAELDHEAIA